MMINSSTSSFDKTLIIIISIRTKTTNTEKKQ